MTTMTATSTQIYQVFIKATPDEIWEAITKPEFTRKYFHGARIETSPELRRTYVSDPADAWEDNVLEWEPPRRLVHGWRSA